MKVQNILNDKKIFKTTLKVQFRECIVGEYHDQENQVCEECPIDKFSFSTKEICKDCSDRIEFEKCFGGATTSLRDGYWRYSNTSKNIYKCNNKNCIAEKKEHKTYSGNYLCRKGHTGATCESCDFDGTFWGEKYIQKSLNTCSRCLSILSAFMSLLGFTIVKLFFIYFMTTKSIQDQNALIINRILRFMNWKQNKVEQRLKHYSGICETNEERYRIACSRIKQNKILWTKIDK